MFWTYLKNLFSKTEEAPDPMKYLIAGLGNMGPKYDGTRHNIGFDIVDALATKHSGKWKNDTLGDIAEIKYRGRTLVLLKPSTYMNLSGKAVRYWLQKKKIELTNLLVITDDKNIDYGAIRLKGKGSDGGHNGIKHINETMGSKYARLRVGIGNNFPKGQQVDFVLGKWSAAENKHLAEVVSLSADAAESFAAIGVQRTMNSFNGKKAFEE